jgi:hypothetical protein
MFPTPSEMMDDDTDVRVEALKWMTGALSDLDRAIEAGQTETAKKLLQRLRHVLDTLEAPPESRPLH